VSPLLAFFAGGEIPAGMRKMKAVLRIVGEPGKPRGRVERDARPIVPSA
jgi:hypothetical protein